MKKCIVLDKRDNVGCMLDDTAPGDDICWEADGATGNVASAEKVPFGFKIALRAIASGEGILKYGQVIGYASRDIAAGQCVHVHNVEGGRGRGDLEKKAG